MVADIEMPAMDGHNLTKRIKEDGELKILPVILFSSLITDKLRHKGEAVGADDQISKPDVSQLAMRAKALIEQNSAPRRRPRKRKMPPAAGGMMPPDPSH